MKWEYTIHRLPFPPGNPDNAAYLNRLGELGWEAINGCLYDSRKRVNSKLETFLEQVVYFKRPLLEPKDPV